jgi:hypothetical protein
MKKAFWVFGLLMAFAFVALASSAIAPANFAGTWKLDKDKSKGLSQGMQSAESVIWTITQDDKQITIDSKVTAAAIPAAGTAAGGPGSGGGGGMRGGGMGGPRTYTLDGKEVTTDAGGQMGGSNTMKSSWSNEGKTLELSSVRTGNREGVEFKFTSSDKMSLSADGKVLTVERHSDSPRGPQESTLVFNKQ